MNQTINPFHIVLLLFISVVYKHQKRVTKKGKVDKTDLIRNSLENTAHVSPLFQIVLALVPVYLLLTNENTNGSVIESIFVMLTYVFSVRTFQNIVNPKLNGNINFVIPFVTILLLNSVYNNIIPRHYIRHIYFYLAIMSVVTLKTNEQETTTSITNDIILSHIVFYLNK